MLYRDLSIMYYETYKPMLKNGFTYQAFDRKDVVLPGFNIPLVPLNNSNKRRCRIKSGMTAFLFFLWKNPDYIDRFFNYPFFYL